MWRLHIQKSELEEFNSQSNPQTTSIKTACLTAQGNKTITMFATGTAELTHFANGAL